MEHEMARSEELKGLLLARHREWMHHDESMATEHARVLAASERELAAFHGKEDELLRLQRQQRSAVHTLVRTHGSLKSAFQRLSRVRNAL
jgi:hypothetical protein